MKKIMEHYDCYNIFLIHTNGDIVYTVAREADLGVIIFESELKDSAIEPVIRFCSSSIASFSQHTLTNHSLSFKKHSTKPIHLTS